MSKKTLNCTKVSIDSIMNSDRARKLSEYMRLEGESVARNTRGFNDGRYAAVAGVENYESLKERARQIKEKAIAELPELINRTKEAVEKRGGTVFVAADAKDANSYIQSVTSGARRVVKSKSMTSEEIHLNKHLEMSGIQVVETDLAEWILQLAQERSSHLVAPAIHKSRAEIADLFNKTFEISDPLSTAEDLTKFARAKLWELFKNADVGITGANFITADTGTIVLVTSEGNARKTVLAPPKYIAVAGIEKIIPSISDLQPFVELIGRSATGQHITSYISLLNPPFETPNVVFDSNKEVVHDRSFHLVLIDNGRMAMRDDAQLRETLYCIRCGACANVCANFQSVGGHAFGGQTYTGGIATGWEAGVHGLDSAASFNELCTGCSRCVEACPVKIDIPWINVVVRDRLNRGQPGAWDMLVEGLSGKSEDNRNPLQKWAVAKFDRIAQIGSLTAPLSNWFNRRKFVKVLVERIIGLDRRRPLPEFKRQTLRRWFNKRRSTSVKGAKSLVLYADPYTNFVLTNRGKAAVHTLECLGMNVCIPNLPGSGRVALSQGMIGQAEQRALAFAEAVVPYLDGGHDLVVIEPSDLAMMQREYEKLLPAEMHEQICERSYELLEYVDLAMDGFDDSTSSSMEGLSLGKGERVAFHSHCQQRTLGLHTHTVNVLEKLGYDVWESSVECCGMAGSFGYKTDYYDVSMQVGEELRQQLCHSEIRDRIPLASGTSCHEQIEALVNQKAIHPIELISPC